ncbi:helix-turn-helix domain-containing protein [Flexivirga meconopsidis]|uniref:helix-turn-helix domain-containing protein n=1 Tax=Flexivirga meconopsidis TaxID=2977121 RepID=UPI00223F5F35
MSSEWSPVYREWALGPGVTAWTSVSGTGPVRVLPDGCLDLLWTDGSLSIAGPDTVAKLVPGESGRRRVGLRFAPGVGPGILGVPAGELTDLQAPADALPSAQRRRLGRGLRHTDLMGPAEIATTLLDSLDIDGGDPFVTRLADLAAAGTALPAIGRALDLSPRQLHRRSVAAFGYGPKQLHRISRFQRALSQLRAGLPAAECAVRTGFSDQSHLSREVRALAGVPIRELTQARGAKMSTPLPSGSSTLA